VTDLRIPGAAGLRTPPDAPVPAPRAPADPPVTDPAPPVDEGVQLGRMLRLAGLTPAQALVVAADLLAAVLEQTNPDGGSQRVTVERVAIGGDGRVVLRPPADRPDAEGAPAGSPPGVVVGALLADIARAARSRAGHADSELDPLQAEFDRAVAELPLAGVAAVARTLGEAAARTDRTAVRAGLGVLAQAIGRHAWQDRGAGRAGGPSTAIRTAAAPRAVTQEKHHARRRIGAWFLSILVLAAVVALENTLLHDKVAADIGVLLDAGRGGSTPSSAAPKPDGLHVVPPAPAAAGGVRGLDLRPLAECTPGAPCAVRLLVRVVPATGPQVVTWSYRLVDRCTGAVVAGPGGTASVPAGQDRVAVIGTVALPKAPAVGVVAVTAVPAVAASAPVLVGSCG
jgi:hypothetical protein